MGVRWHYKQGEKMVLNELIEKFERGDRLALARIFSIVEKREEGFRNILKRIKVERRAYIIGITGPPGAGKSSFIASLIELYLNGNEKVGVIAFDPYSPYTGGAILGDRIRMAKYFTDDRVYIRSVSVGGWGGVSPAVFDMIRVLEGSGFGVIIIETVGVGQIEVGIKNVADTVVVLLTPEGGDAVQTLKAGLLEVGDILVVNKADRKGADEFFEELRFSCEIERDGWKVPVMRTIAIRNIGIREVKEKIDLHRDYIERSGKKVEMDKMRKKLEFIYLLEEEFNRRIKFLEDKGLLKNMLEGDVYEGAETFWKDEKILEVLIRG